MITAFKSSDGLRLQALCDIVTQDAGPPATEAIRKGSIRFRIYPA